MLWTNSMLINPTCTYYGVYCQLGFACETTQDYCQLVVELQHEWLYRWCSRKYYHLLLTLLACWRKKMNMTSWNWLSMRSCINNWRISPMFLGYSHCMKFLYVAAARLHWICDQTWRRRLGRAIVWIASQKKSYNCHSTVEGVPRKNSWNFSVLPML